MTDLNNPNPRPIIKKVEEDWNSDRISSRSAGSDSDIDRQYACFQFANKVQKCSLEPIHDTVTTSPIPNHQQKPESEPNVEDLYL